MKRAFIFLFSIIIVCCITLSACRETRDPLKSTEISDEQKRELIYQYVHSSHSSAFINGEVLRYDVEPLYDENDEVISYLVVVERRVAKVEPMLLFDEETQNKVVKNIAFKYSHYTCSLWYNGCLEEWAVCLDNEAFGRSAYDLYGYSDAKKYYLKDEFKGFEAYAVKDGEKFRCLQELGCNYKWGTDISVEYPSHRSGCKCNTVLE